MDGSPDDAQVAAAAAQQAAMNRTTTAFADHASVVHLVAAQVERTPDAPALIGHDGVVVSYRRFSESIDRVARSLVARGIGRGSVVGVYLPRSSDFVIAVHGVLRAGAAFLPIEAGLPAQRIAAMCDDAGVCLAITTRTLAGRLVEARAEALCLEDLADDGAAGGTPAAIPAIDLDDPAYVISTSGSTGRPKGAINSHRGLANRLLWKRATFDLGPEQVLLHKTPCGFDVSVWELIGPFIAGARLAILEPDAHHRPDRIGAAIAEHGVTLVHFVPSMLHRFLEAGQHARCSSLRSVLCSGEALTAALRDRVFASLPEVRLHNLYGPAEAAIDVTHWECRRDEPRPVVPIGRPIANTRIHILDERLRPLPAGASGELFIGGVQVGLGYCARPELTAERFLPDPFGDPSRDRLYRSGDRARFDAAGVIEFLGRVDHQIKLRGVRIEPGEIESVLESHPWIEQAVVVAHRAGDEDPILVAYLRCGDRVPALFDLRTFLDARLPTAMVPARFVMLDAVPLSPNGKVDRSALPAPTAAAPQAPYVAPRNAIERDLVERWQRLIGVERVGVEDHFFVLGGHSILVAQLLMEIGEAHGAELSMNDLLGAPTVAAFAPLVAARSGRRQRREAAEVDDLLADIAAMTPEQIRSELAKLEPAADNDGDRSQDRNQRGSPRG